MIEATVTVHDRNSAGNLDQRLMHTKHTFNYRSTRSGDTVAELEDLISFLDKLRVGNGGKPNQVADSDMAKMSGYIQDVLTCVTRSLKFAKGGSTTYVLAELLGALRELEDMCDAFFPDVRDRVAKEVYVGGRHERG